MLNNEYVHILPIYFNIAYVVEFVDLKYKKKII